MGRIVVGERFQNKYGTWAVVVAYDGAENVTIEFEYDQALCSNVVYGYNKNNRHLRAGNFKGPYCRSVQNIGYVGVGDFMDFSDPCVYALYADWQGILYRCYSDTKVLPSYSGVFVEEKWHNFQNFAQWGYAQQGSDMVGWHLDKDLLSREGEPKRYSPETCTYLPHSINSSLPKKGNSGITREGAESLKFQVDFYSESLSESAKAALAILISDGLKKARKPSAPVLKVTEVVKILTQEEREVLRKERYLQRRRAAIKEHIKNRKLSYG